MASEREKLKEEARRNSGLEWAQQQDRGFEVTHLRLPPGREQFRLTKLGSEELDILKYRAGHGNPRADPGFEQVDREYHAHRIPMPNGRDGMYCCLWETFGKRCPVCEWVNTNGRTADPKLLQKLRAKKRHLFNVIDVGKGETQPKLFDAAHFGFGTMLVDAINAVHKYGHFAERKGGFTLHITVKDLPLGGGGTYKGASRIDFLPREKDYSKDILEQMICLDECLVPLAPSSLKNKAVQDFTDADWKACYVELKKLIGPEESAEEESAEEESAEEESAEEESAEEESEEEEHSTVRSQPEEEPEDELDQDEEETAAEETTEPVTRRNHKPASRWKVGQLVNYKGKEMEIVEVADNGALMLEYQGNGTKEEPDRTYQDVPPERVQAWEEEKPAPRKQLPAKPKARNEPEEDEDEDEDDEYADTFDEDDDEDEDEDEEEPEEEEPVVKKKPKRRG